MQPLGLAMFLLVEVNGLVPLQFLYAAGISFARPEYAEFQFGNVLGGGQDWLLATSGLRAGDSFSITATVPEPSSAALVLPLGVVWASVALRAPRSR